MTLQRKVYQEQALGVVGEFADTSPKRVAAYVLRANGDVTPKIGCVYTSTSKDNELKIGGTGVFAGIAVGTNQYSADNFNSSLTLTDGAIAEICSMGHIFVATKTEVKPNYVAAFDPATGEIYGYESADAATTAKHTLIPNAKFVFCSADENGTAVLELNP
nr:MAG TPA: hypothetical protein [Caudoviricetes sp.]